MKINVSYCWDSDTGAFTDATASPDAVVNPAVLEPDQPAGSRWMVRTKAQLKGDSGGRICALPGGAQALPYLAWLARIAEK